MDGPDDPKSRLTRDYPMPLCNIGDPKMLENRQREGGEARHHLRVVRIRRPVFSSLENVVVT